MTGRIQLRVRPSRWSLTQRQLAVIGGCLTLLALLLGVGGAWFINGVAERASDHLLAASAQSITDTIGVENGSLTLEVSPNALGMLASGGRNRVFYSVTQGARVLTGYPNFPHAGVAGVADGEPRFRYARFLGTDVRVATQVRRLPRLAEPAVVQVAETLDERHALARSMLVGLALLETVLVGFAVFLVWPAILWGLKPLIAVRREIDAREPTRLDFTPLSTDSVPPELNGLITGFNELLDRLDRSTAGVQRFTADASHQMRTPLAALRTHVELLQRAPAGDEAVASSMRDIADSVDRLQRLVTQLLALARAEAEGDGGLRSSADAADIAREVCLRLAPAADRAGLELRFEAVANCFVPLEPLLLEELIANLVDNAIRYHGHGSYVLVRVDAAEGGTRITVEDDGRGIPAEHRPRLGERFFRLPRDQDKPGSGLGLSIAFAICERAGATLDMTQSSEPRRFQVVLRFPPGEIPSLMVPQTGLH